ncbi:MAG: PAS domain-containing protein, partial [Spirochaetota bacterium]
DRDGVYTMVNPAMEKLFGRDAADIIGKTDHDLFGEETGNAVKESDETVYRGETVEEFPGKPIDGILHTFHTIKVPLYDTEGYISGLCGIARDITELKQQQEHLQISKLAIENSLTGIAIADIHYRITYVNPACLSIWELDSIDEVIGRSIFDFWKDRELIHKDVQDILNGHKLYVEREAYKNDGSKSIILVSATMVNDANNEGATLGIIANFLDITDKKAAEKQLQIALEKKQELLRELQHRAKNSFNTIKSLMHIKSMSLSNQEAIESIEELRTRVHALAELYTMLHDTDSPDLVDLGEYCQRVAFLTSEMTLHVSIHKSMDSVQSNTRNAATVGLIVTELITNAIKYAFPDGNGGTIKCELKKQDRGAVLIVEDNGVGMPENFDLDNTSSMGLMLVRSMVKQLGGVMEIESDNGTRFTITLPELI